MYSSCAYGFVRSPEQILASRNHPTAPIIGILQKIVSVISEILLANRLRLGNLHANSAAAHGSTLYQHHLLDSRSTRLSLFFSIRLTHVLEHLPAPLFTTHASGVLKKEQN
jgi:hypothetical protein